MEQWLKTHGIKPKKETISANGNRCLVVQLKSGSIIPRQLDIRHEETNIRGRTEVFYTGQPYECNHCNTVHEGQCPKRMAGKERQEEKLGRELKNKTIIISDSTLRKADENKLNADIICVPGGKLGHLANSLNYNGKILKYDN